MKIIVNLLIIGFLSLFLINPTDLFSNMGKVSVGIQYIMIVFLVSIVVFDYLKILKKQIGERLKFRWKALKRKLKI